MTAYLPLMVTGVIMFSLGYLVGKREVRHGAEVRGDGPQYGLVTPAATVNKPAPSFNKSVSDETFELLVCCQEIEDSFRDSSPSQTDPAIWLVTGQVWEGFSDMLGQWLQEAGTEHPLSRRVRSFRSNLDFYASRIKETQASRPELLGEYIRPLSEELAKLKELAKAR